MTRQATVAAVMEHRKRAPRASIVDASKKQEAATVIQRHVRGKLARRRRAALASSYRPRAAVAPRHAGLIHRVINGKIKAVDRDEAVQQLVEKITEGKHRRVGYQNCGLFLMFTVLLFIILSRMTHTQVPYPLRSAILNKLVLSDTYLAENGQLKSALRSENDIFGWLADTVVRIMWADPVCGDGVCEPNIEMPGFGDKGGESHLSGCPADCGYYPYTKQISIAIDNYFYSTQEQNDANWNLCTVATQLDGASRKLCY